MHTQDANQSISPTKGRKRRWVVVVGSGAVLAILAVAAFWFIEHRSGAKAVSRAPGSSASVFKPQASVPSDRLIAGSGNQSYGRRSDEGTDSYRPRDEPHDPNLSSRPRDRKTQRIS